jgi:hypothetical protein
MKIQGRFAEKAKSDYMVFAYHGLLWILRRRDPAGGFEEMATTPLGN